jgi:hypothetical protein
VPPRPGEMHRAGSALGLLELRHGMSRGRTNRSPLHRSPERPVFLLTVSDATGMRSFLERSAQRIGSSPSSVTPAPRVPTRTSYRGGDNPVDSIPASDEAITREISRGGGLMVTARWPRQAGIGIVVGVMMTAGLMLSPVSAWASKSAAPGTVSCAGVTGVIRFSPPLAVAAGSVTVSAFLKLSDCIIGSGSRRTPTVAHAPDTPPTIVTGTLMSTGSATLSCSYLTGEFVSLPLVTGWTTRWASPVVTSPTTSSFTGLESEAGPAVSLPGAGGASANGSYTGLDGGGSSTLHLVYSIRNDNRCSLYKSELGSLKVTSGHYFSG